MLQAEGCNSKLQRLTLMLRHSKRRHGDRRCWILLWLMILKLRDVSSRKPPYATPCQLAEWRALCGATHLQPPM